jgi:hypothetical protein
MDSGATIQTLHTAARAITAASDLDCVRAIQTAQDALDAEKAVRLAAIELSRSYELEGASTLATWTRTELRMSAKEAKALARASFTFGQLPQVAEAARAGLIRLNHVNVFTYGLKHIGAPLLVSEQEWLVDIAKKCEPAELLHLMKSLREALFPDELDQAWMDGMDKQDFQVMAVPDGFHVRGFLNVTAGAKLQAVIDALSAPRDADDARTGSDRRVQAVEDLASKVLEEGLPSDKGIRPQIAVTVDADTLEAALAQAPYETGTPNEPATLAGFGHIGPKLLSLTACNADITPILTQRPPDMSNGRLSNRSVPRTQSQVLNVGRTKRHATRKQRLAIIARQLGVCAAPSCSHTHLEIHHVVWWKRGGPTDVDLMVGLCIRCHHLVHRDLLRVRADGVGGFAFSNKDNRPMLAAHRERVRAHRELGHLRRVTREVNRRREEHLTNLRT